MGGADKRVDLIAEDLVEHFENRLDAMDGKGMIVCMTRRICVELYSAITRLRPDWHDDDDTKGTIKVVMTGSASDPLEPDMVEAQASLLARLFFPGLEDAGPASNRQEEHR